jgi:outer membrane protein assembly factor BamB
LRCILLIAFLCSATLAQVTTPENPVYVDDSTAARDVLSRLASLERQGSMAEAVRAVQELLDQQGDRLLVSDQDSDLYRSVRQIIHERVVSDQQLLEAYRKAQEPQASRQLDRGEFDRLCQSRFLTQSGFEAALRRAQLQLERAAFNASLITLVELEAHPDFASRRDEAASVLALLAPYLDPQPEKMLARWGATERMPQIVPPPGVNPPVVGPTQSGFNTHIEGIIPRPLTSADLSPTDKQIADPDQLRFANERMMSDEGIYGWTLPSVVDDVIYTNDGDHITAWDRFTLRQKWRVSRTEPSNDGLFSRRDIRRRQSRRIEDSAEVTIADDHLLAITGLAVSGTRQGDSRLHCIERETGVVLWSVDPADLDPTLEGASLRGPAAVVEGTVVVALRKWARERRTVSVYLVGLDLDTGLLRWSRLIGSAGALPFQTAGRFPERITADRGVVYRSDEIGVIAAVEVDTGRPRWVRKFDSFKLYDNDVRPPFSSSGPIIDGDRIISIEPNRQRIVALDADTGAILGTMNAVRMANPNYLLTVGTQLVAIGEHQIAWTDLSGFPKSGVRASDAMLSPPIVGRVAVGAGSIVIPRNGLLTTLNLETRKERTREIDEPGNLLALDGQLLAADDSQLHSYMVWDVASQLLQARLEEDPSNPAPAATLAELAFRANRFDQIIEPVDRALEAIRRNPNDHEQTRKSLFISVLGMLDPATAARLETPDERSQIPKIADTSLLWALTERLEALAETPEEMVSHRFVQASLREAAGEVTGSIESLQSILSDQFLASSFWRGGQLTIRADLEATRRIRATLLEKGWSAYADFEREARAQQATLAPDADSEQLESLALAYPFSALVPEFWLDSARTDDPGAALRSLLSGIKSLETLRSLGAPIDSRVGGELFGRAVQSLVEAGRDREARKLLETRSRLFADLQLTINDLPVSGQDMVGSDTAATESRARARIGLAIDIRLEPELEQGRILVAAMAGARAPLTDKVLLASPSGRTIRLLSLSDDGTMVELWTRQATFEPILLEMTDDDALIAWLDPQGTRIESIDIEGGLTRWETRPIEPAGGLDGINRASMLSGFITPLEGRVLSEQVLIVGDERILGIVERTGRIVTLDRQSGRTIWSGESDVQRVFDVALKSGILVVAGTAPDAAENWKTIIVTLDARSGEVANRLDDAPGSVRWVRISEDRKLIAGLGRGLICVDLSESQVRWLLAEEPAKSSIDAWVFGDQLYILDQNRSLWRVDIASGRLIRPELETRGRLIDRVGIQVRQVDGHVVFASGSGMLVFDQDNELVGIDVFDAVGALVPSEPGEKVTAMIDSAPVQSPDGLSSYMLYLMANDSGRLLASYPIRTHATPETITLLDGKILISAGEATLVIDAPTQR